MVYVRKSRLFMVIFFPKKFHSQKRSQSRNATNFLLRVGGEVNAVCVTADKKKSDGAQSAVTPDWFVGKYTATFKHFAV